MRIDGFLAELPSLWRTDPQVADYPVDRRFASLLRATGGMGTENKLAVLNLAATFLENDELYLEIGAFQGTSIAAAALDNPTGKFITVDNFSEFGGPSDECRANILRYSSGNVTLIDQDCWNVLANPPFTERVGVYFYDGPHEYKDQWQALEQVEPLLADTALVMVDDASWLHVRAANSGFVRTHPRFSYVRRFKSDGLNGPRWWNGLDMIRYDRSGPAHDPVRVRGVFSRGSVVSCIALERAERLRHHATGWNRRVKGSIRRRLRP